MKKLVALIVFLAASTTMAQPSPVPIVIDGQFDPAEWAAATNYAFTVNLPAGGATSGQLYIINDKNNLYICMRVQEPATQAAESFAIDFDAPSRDNAIGPGDDGLVLSIFGFCARQKVFADDFWYSGAPPCPAGALCSGKDTDFGGTSDGNGAVDNDGAWTTFELWHPLASGDLAHDIHFKHRDELKFRVEQVGIDATNTMALMFYPAQTQLATYVIR